MRNGGRKRLLKELLDENGMIKEIKAEPMKTYKLVEVWYDDYVTLRATDSAIFDQLLSELRTNIPTADKRHSAGFTSRDILTDTHWEVEFYELENRDPDVFWWIITRLGELGWEPISVTAREEGSVRDWAWGTKSYSFRKAEGTN